MPTTNEPNPAAGCPVCHGPLWDNRETKRNPKAPDYKCKDKNCDGAIWPPKNGAAPARPTAPSNAKQPFSGGPHIPGLDEAPDDAYTKALDFERFDKMKALYTNAYLHAAELAHGQFGNDVSDVAVSSMTATLFIQACEAGLHR
jgi:hypothetical protein